MEKNASSERPCATQQNGSEYRQAYENQLYYAASSRHAFLLFNTIPQQEHNEWSRRCLIQYGAKAAKPFPTPCQENVFRRLFAGLRRNACRMPGEVPRHHGTLVGMLFVVTAQTHAGTVESRRWQGGRV